MTKYRVWHTPQSPCPEFHVEVNSLEEAVKICDVLGNYDLFQLKHNIKPDYSNVNGVQIMEDGEWVDWEIDDLLLGYFDDPDEYLEAKAEAGIGIK